MIEATIPGFENPRRVTETPLGHARYIELSAMQAFYTGATVSTVGFYAQPFVLTKTIKINRIACRIISTQAGKKFQMGIYGIDMTKLALFPYPGDLVCSSDTRDIIAGVHVYSFATPVILPGGRILFGCTRHDYGLYCIWRAKSITGFLLGGTQSQPYHGWYRLDAWGSIPYGSKLPDKFPESAGRAYLDSYKGPVLGVRMVY